MKTIDSVVSWGDTDIAVVSSLVHAVKAKAGSIEAFRHFKKGKPKATTGGFNAKIGLIKEKAKLVLDGGIIEKKFKDELGNVMDDLSEQHIYKPETDAKTREMAQTFLTLATNFYTKPQRGRKSKSTNDLAQLFADALAELNSEDDEETTEE